jgi:hypothetical protein
LVFLSPLIVLVPTSLMILNRARTRNRKAAFMLVSLDYKRLCIAGVKTSETLKQVQSRDNLPWETHLHIVERWNSDKGPHLAPALLYMVSCSVAMELLCIGLAFWIAWGNRWNRVGVAVVLLINLGLVAYRCRALWLLTGVNSIQGYAVAWLKRKYPNSDIQPLYLSEFVARYETLSQKNGPSRF